MNCLVTPTKAMGYSNLYLDFLADVTAVGRFFPVPTLDAATVNLDKMNCDREKMTTVLMRQNIAFGASEKTRANIELLRKENTLCLFAGQQAGLFGGPLLVVLKAIAITKAARQYSERLRRPVIPIFWIAGDDHDFEEVNHTFVLDQKTQSVRITYDTLPCQKLPTAEITFSDAGELERAKKQLRKALGRTDFTDDLYKLIDQSYSPEETFVTAFGKFMTALVGEPGLIFFFPGDLEVKRQAG